MSLEKFCKNDYSIYLARVKFINYCIPFFSHSNKPREHVLDSLDVQCIYTYIYSQMTRDQLFISNWDSDVPAGLISNLTTRHRYFNRRRHGSIQSGIKFPRLSLEQGEKEREREGRWRSVFSIRQLGCEEICKGNRGFGYTLLHSWARSRSQAFVTRIICTRTAARGWFRDLNIRRDLDHFTCSFPREVTWGTKTAFLSGSRAPLNIHSPHV